MTITGTPPDRVGDVASFACRYPAPAERPGAAASGIVIRVQRPNGQIVDDSAGATSTGSGEWLYVQTFKIDQPGPWRWKVETTGTLVASDVLKAGIKDDTFPAI